MKTIKVTREHWDKAVGEVNQLSGASYSTKCVIAQALREAGYELRGTGSHVLLANGVCFRLFDHEEIMKKFDLMAKYGHKVTEEDLSMLLPVEIKVEEI